LTVPSLAVATRHDADNPTHSAVSLAATYVNSPKFTTSNFRTPCLLLILLLPPPPPYRLQCVHTLNYKCKHSSFSNLCFTAVHSPQHFHLNCTHAVDQQCNAHSGLTPKTHFGPLTSSFSSFSPAQLSHPHRTVGGQYFLMRVKLSFYMTLRSVSMRTAEVPAVAAGFRRQTTLTVWMWSVLDVELNPLKPELNPICYLLALLRAHHFLHVSRIRVKLLTLR